jgi:uncharacterized RmlC-like cupin family protein
VSHHMHYVHRLQHHMTTRKGRSLYFPTGILYAKVFLCRKTITCSIENFEY